MHILAPKPSRAELPVFFNVDGVVGASPARNLFEDVLFVQFVLRFIADHGTVTTPGLLPILSAVRTTGLIDTATIEAIRAAQSVRPTPGTVIDGRVSPAHGYVYGGAVWSIVHFNNILQELTRDVWPRLDKLSDCPAALASAVVRCVVGNEG